MHHPSQLTAKLEEIRPYIQMLASLCFLNTDIGTKSITEKLNLGLMLVAEYMRHHGVDPDPNQTLLTLYEDLKRHEEFLRSELQSH